MPDNTRKYAANTRGRPFPPGNPGKPKGTRHKATQAIQALLDGESEALTRKAIELALAGDATALRLCLDRILPVLRERPVVVELPPLTGSQEAVAASAALLAAVAAGEIAPGEAREVGRLLELHLKAVEQHELDASTGGAGGAAEMTTTLERRLGAVEKRWGVDRGRLADFTDLDLLGAIHWCGERLAEIGNVNSIAMLAEHDEEEAQLRAFYERPDVAARCKMQLEPNVRWPYLRACARSVEEQSHYRGPRPARTENELQQKINAMLATLGSLS